MAGRLSLSAKLSQALVAFTIEFDNEFEHRTDHHTTQPVKSGQSVKSGSPGAGPWLTSQVMWANVMQYVPTAGIAVGDLHARARTARDSLAGLQRRGYVVVAPDRGRGAAVPTDSIVSPTPAGRIAQKTWEPLAAVVEQRWEERFGAEPVDRLRGSLRPSTNNGKAELFVAEPAPAAHGTTPRDDLSALLAKVLLAFTLDFELESRISLPISANTLRVLDESGVRLRDLPRLTGVSKEANSMAVGFLARRECVVVEADPGAGRGKVVRLTPKGQRARAEYHRILDTTEQHWRTRFGAGLTPYPDGWRASVRKPESLPHYPMVLHRGGYPDGS
jgi:DNA-binding MarR family transcriptional regulator